MTHEVSRILPGYGASIVGSRFGRLTISGRPFYVRLKSGNRRAWCVAECICGKKIAVEYDAVRSGQTGSCGCLQRDRAVEAATKHGACRRNAKSPEFNIWTGIIKRCENEKAISYPRYGGRGISICERWRRSFPAFLEDMGPRPSPEHSIERIDNSKNYEPWNCKWATRTEQARNKRNNRLLTAFGKTQCVPEWADEVGISARVIHGRLKLGWKVEDVLSRPVRIDSRSKLIRLIAFFSLTLACSAAIAEPPRAVLNGPTDGIPGDIVEISADESIATHYLFTVIPERFPDGKPTFKMASDSKSCYIASRPGKYRVLLIVSNDEGPAFTWHTVTILQTDGQPPVTPTQPPTQPTDPTTPTIPPVTPQPQTLSDWVLKTAVATITTTRPTATAKFATSYRKWAANGGVAKNVEEFAKVQDALNKAVLTVGDGLTANDLKEWDTFFKALAVKLSSLNLATVADAQKAWLEIADGLGRAARVQ